MPGRYKGEDVTIQDVFEAIGAQAAGRITEQELIDLENVASPGAGACGGQFTANTMAMALEVLGISPIGAAMVPAENPSKAEVAYETGKLIMDVLARGQRPSDIITRDGLENAIAAVATSGGSTNGVLHLLAIAREAGVELNIDDFDRISSKTPMVVRPQAGRPLRRRRPAPGRRHPGRRQAPAGAGAAPRRRADRHRPHDRRARRRGAGDARPARRGADRRADQGDRRPRHPQGQPRPRGLRGQAERARARARRRALRACSRTRRRRWPPSAPAGSWRATSS